MKFLPLLCKYFSLNYHNLCITRGCYIFILNGILVIQNIFLDESHGENQKSVVINAKKVTAEKIWLLQFDLHFKRCSSYKNIFGCITLYNEKNKIILKYFIYEKSWILGFSIFKVKINILSISVMSLTVCLNLEGPWFSISTFWVILIFS